MLYDYENLVYDHENDTEDIPFPDVTHPVRMTQSEFEHENDTDDIPAPDITHPVRMNFNQKKRFEHSDDTEDIP